MISFAPNFKEFYTSGQKIFIKIANAWCDGNQIQILENITEQEENYEKIESNLWDEILVFVEKDKKHLLDGGYLSQAGKKIIFAHKDNILTRCGCGKSFSFKSGNAAKDKIAILRKKLKSKNKVIHHDD